MVVAALLVGFKEISGLLCSYNADGEPCMCEACATGFLLVVGALSGGCKEISAVLLPLVRAGSPLR